MNLRPLNLFEMPLAGPHMIEASAGTGKTWTITGLYTRLVIEHGLKVPEILVVTFTEAATAELRDRIRGRLAEVLESFEGEEALDPFCEQLLIQHADRRTEVMRRLQRAIASLDEAAIHTIHAFCQRVLVQSAFESGADFGMEILSDTGPVLDEIAADFWREQVYPSDAIYTEYLLKNKASPAEWLRVVYGYLGQPLLHTVELGTPADTTELSAALPAAFENYRQLWSVHSTTIKEMLLELSANKALKQTSYKPDQLEKAFLLIDDHIAGNGGWQDIDSKELMKLGSSKLISGTAKGNAPPEHAFFDAVELLTSLINDLSAACQLRQKQGLAELRRRCDIELPERLARRQQLSFNDLLLRVWQGLTAEGGERLAIAMRRRYKAALIDEFQDTDGIQYDIFSRVFADGSTPLFLVGDPKQAIYSFRGADIHAYHQAETLVDAKESLDTNQRSVPALVTAVNTLFERPAEAFVDPHVSFSAVKAASKPRPELIVDGENDTPDTGRKSAPFRFQFLPEPEGVSDKGVQISWPKETANHLAAQITAQEIEKLLRLAGEGKARLADKPLSGGDMAVLVPDRFRAKAMQDALTQLGVPSVLRVRDSVWESQEAVELYTVLAAISEPAKQGLVRAALISTLLGNNAATLLRLEINGWDQIADAFAHWKKIWQTQGFIPMFREWLEYQGLDGLNVAQRLLSLTDGERRLTNLLQLAELLQAHKATGLEQHLAWFSRQNKNAGDEALLRLESDEDRVRIVTLHASKGLEYPIVFCPFLWDGRLLGKHTEAVRYHQNGKAWLDLGSENFDEHKDSAKREAFEEKLRLLYVGLTRARNRCYIVWGNIGLKDGRGYAISDGLSQSAMAWLLHPLCREHGDVLEAQKEHLKAYDHATLLGEITAMCEQQPEVFALHDAPSGARTGLKTTPAEPLVFKPYLGKKLYPTWRVASFSGMTAHNHSEGPDRDSASNAPETDSSAAPEGRSVFSFPEREAAATVAGTCLHAILEEWDWQDADALLATTAKELERHGIPEHWLEIVSQMVQDTVSARLDGKGLTLASIPPNKRVAEMEFTYSVSHCQPERLIAALQHPSLPPEFRAASGTLDFFHINGFLRGFIDLVFEYENAFYVLDYKSNWLGNRVADYAPAHLIPAMAQHHYYLQYLIYSAAVRRFLRQRLPNFSDDQFGGVYYLFMRGLGKQDGQNGVYFSKPSMELLDDIEVALMGNAVKT
ncbi:exodeoxyribonuclease V subunit beta [Iodobacter ciconiae]|uniref:RecBCD enzyme subunit RecB n=1 Tax=Iodobacter ciconiae TaxID=2496266 RepID=A0A3S8ZTE0_9NEIS|nr:exodeoxyribonuclease V subunit beta [Iodobacter ciconiae]AZN36748.1 exodeoxyribonuclease V subunit beta [Iodobacter ciconiae]